LHRFTAQLKYDTFIGRRFLLHGLQTNIKQKMDMFGKQNA